jgi:hypothetical protein
MKLTDQTVLGKVAVEDVNMDIRTAAIARLTNQGLLARLAIEDRDRAVRGLAVMALAKLVRPADQTLLAKVIVESKERESRALAAACLTDQVALATVAAEATDRDMRVVAVSRLIERAALGNVADLDKDESVRRAADARLAELGQRRPGMSKCDKCGKSAGFSSKLEVLRPPAQGRRADTLCKECYEAVMDKFKKQAEANDLIPTEEPKCSDCYYFLNCRYLAADPPAPMTSWPPDFGACNLGQRKPFTMSPGKELHLVKASDRACYEFEQGRGESRTRKGWMRLG